MLMSAGAQGNLLVLNYGWAYIQKPFVPSKLVQMITEVLHSPDRRSSAARSSTAERIHAELLTVSGFRRQSFFVTGARPSRILRITAACSKLRSGGPQTLAGGPTGARLGCPPIITSVKAQRQRMIT